MDKGKMAGILSVMALLGFMGAFAFLLTNTIPEDNKDLVNIALMALVGFTGTGIGFFLGSSEGSQKKDETIKDLATTPPAGTPGPTGPQGEEGPRGPAGP